jgi:hypothetical protein
VYRKLSPKQQEARKRRIDAMQRGKERAAMAREPRGRMPDLPLVRRLVEVTDYDTGLPVKTTFELRRTSRVDTYLLAINGEPRKRCGWSGVCDILRRAFPRLPSPRSDSWWDQPAER